MNPKRFVPLGLLIAALVVAACGPKATPTPLPPTEPPAPTATTKAPKPPVSEGEVPMGFTEEGAPYRGDPDAPVTLVEYSDYQ
ncbi:MAG TPA: hypothetical protein EYP55_00900 [Anaerolineae bacterium]|nr:hypothetical protein [Anaerolineae bacterium]